jgi:dienelactone hydrolase
MIDTHNGCRANTGYASLPGKPGKATHRSLMARFVLVIAGLCTFLFAADADHTARIEIHSFESVTLSDEQFLTGAKDAKPVAIGGELRLPPGTGRFPVVILVHGSGGIGANVHHWAEELNDIGVAAFLLDSFTARGIVQTGSDQSQLGSLTMIADAYRALAVLAKHDRIDPSRIALMGFSKGGEAALHASLKRFQRMYEPAGVSFAAYIPFYAPCNTTYIEGDEVSDRPIRMFHGSADNWVPVAACRDYVKRLQHLGKDIQLTEFPGAYHAFDNPLSPVQRIANAQVRSRRCFLEEREGGVLVNRETGQPFTFQDSCIEWGAMAGYDPQATSEAIKAVTQFLTSLWKLNEPRIASGTK